MYRLKTTANFNIGGGGGTVDEVIHDNTLIGKGTSESPLKVDQSKFAKPSDLTTKQDILVSGTNIKTINNQSILGSGNINIEGGSVELSTEVKNAILDCFEHVAWVDEHGQDYYDTLSELFFPAKSLVSISAVFNQGQTIIYDNASLDSLKQYLTVTTNYDDSSTETVTNYSLSGTLSAGTSIITVTYQGKTTTFTVYVTAVPTLSSITATYTQSDTVYPSDSLDSLKSDLVVKAIYTDASEIALNESDYTLSGTLTVGTSVVTVVYSNKSTTFNVTVSQAVELSSISAVYTQSGTVYTTDTLDSLKNDLVVTANYTDSSTRTVTDYTLSGSLTAGTSTITVTYSGKTTTFNVTVTAVAVTSIDAVFNQGSTLIYDTDSLDTLKQYLTVTANYNNGTTETLSSSAYTLSGTLVGGTSTITVTYEGKTDTFDVIVTEIKKWLYRFNNNITSSTSNDFGLSGVENYTTGRGGNDVAYLHKVGTEGTASTDVLGLKATSLIDAPDFGKDFTVSYWAASTNSAALHSISYSKYANTSYGSTPYLNSVVLNNDQWTLVNGNGAYGATNKYAGLTIFGTAGSGSFFIAFHNQTLTAQTRIKITPPSNFDITQWHHYALTRKDNTIRFFVDGDLIWTGTTTETTIYPANQIAFGSLFDQSGSNVSDLLPVAYSEKFQDIYIAENCKWTTNFDTSNITY